MLAWLSASTGTGLKTRSWPGGRCSSASGCSKTLRILYVRGPLRRNASNGADQSAKFSGRNVFAEIAPPAFEMLSSISVPPKSFAPASRQASDSSNPNFTHETWILRM